MSPADTAAAADSASMTTTATSSLSQVPAARGRDKLERFARALRAGFAALWPLWAFVLLYLALSRMVLWSLGDYAAYSLLLAALGALTFAYAYVAIFALGRLIAYARGPMPDSPVRQLLRDFRTILFNPARLANFIIIYPLLIVFMFVFAEVKGNIPLIVPFSWDEAFVQWDRWLHGGTDPWRLLEPMLDSAVATFIINFFYNLWFFLVLASLFAIALLRRPDTHGLRYLIAFLFTWSIGGSLLAVLFSSAGPVYYTRLGLSPDPFVPLMEKLRSFNEILPIWALDTQEMLWQMHEQGNGALGGISAFPSMHNAQATLMALAAWRYGRVAGWLATFYAALIFLGSIWLGWHYAVDGYAGIAVGLVAWWLAGMAARWLMQRPVMRCYLAQLQRLDSQQG